jgi:hypothetical protein
MPLEVRNIEGVGSAPTSARIGVVKRSVAEYALDEPIGVPLGNAAAVDGLVVVRLAERAYPESLPDSPPDSETLQPADIQGICANPLRDEPPPALVAAVRRFGVVGLLAGALGTGAMRWWKSRSR